MRRTDGCRLGEACYGLKTEATDRPKPGMKRMESAPKRSCTDKNALSEGHAAQLQACRATPKIITCDLSRRARPAATDR